MVAVCHSIRRQITLAVIFTLTVYGIYILLAAEDPADPVPKTVAPVTGGGAHEGDDPSRIIAGSLPNSTNASMDGGTNSVKSANDGVNQSQAYALWMRHRKEPAVTAYEEEYRGLPRGIVLIDTRPVSHYRAALESAIHFTPETWGVYIIVPMAPDDQTDKLLRTMEADVRELKGVRDQRMVRVLYHSVDIEKELKGKPLKSARAIGNGILYRSLTWLDMSVEHILLIQSDSYVCRTGIEEFVDQHDYIGAPWPHNPMGLLMGNGGSSYRSRSAMVYCNDHAKLKVKKRGFGETSGLSEDVYFSKCVKKTPWLKGANTTEAKLFGMEGVWAPNSLTLHQIHIMRLKEPQLIALCKRCRGVGQLIGIQKKWLSPAPKEQLRHCLDEL